MGNKDPPPDERVVYLALKNVFKGPDAVVRQPRAILKLIRGSQSQGCVESLVREHNIDKVCNVARTLLTEEVFGSTLKAKIRFPEVFDVSPAQSAEREASEEDAARDEASTIKNVAQGYQEDIEAVAPARLAVESEGSMECSHLRTRQTADAPPQQSSLFAAPTRSPGKVPATSPRCSRYTCL